MKTTRVANPALGDAIVDILTDGVDFVDGVDTSFTLSATPLSNAEVQVVFDGLVVTHDQWRRSGAVITYLDPFADSAPTPITARLIECQYRVAASGGGTPTPPPSAPAPTLVTVTDFKLYARIETHADDALIGMLLVEAVGLIESFIGKSLTTEQATFYDDANSFRAYESAGALILPYMQIDPASVVITGPAGNIVDPAGYTVRLDLRQIVGIGSGGIWGAVSPFDAGPYAISCTAGYGTLPDYKSRWLPRIRATIIDYTAFLYQQRTPGASSESASGTRLDYGAIDADTGLPQRVAMALRKLRGIIA